MARFYSLRVETGNVCNIYFAYAHSVILIMDMTVHVVSTVMLPREIKGDTTVTVSVTKVHIM